MCPPSFRSMWFSEGDFHNLTFVLIWHNWHLQNNQNKNHINKSSSINKYVYHIFFNLFQNIQGTSKSILTDPQKASACQIRSNTKFQIFYWTGQGVWVCTFTFWIWQLRGVQVWTGWIKHVCPIHFQCSIIFDIFGKRHVWVQASVSAGVSNMESSMMQSGRIKGRRTVVI